MDKRNKGELEDTVPIAHLFDVLKDGKKNAAILVEAWPGYGKTSFVQKLCLDFANEEEYIKYFDLVLLFRPQSIKGGLEEILARADGVEDNMQIRCIWSVVDATNKVLLIIDGGNEVPEQYLQEFLSELNCKIKSHVSVLVTSRPHKYMLNRVEGVGGTFTLLSEFGISNERVHWDKTMEIMGFKEEEQKDMFIQQYSSEFDVATRNELCHNVKRLIDSLEIAESPLFMFMVIVLVTDEERDFPPSRLTRTELYKHFLALMIRRYFRKIGSPLELDIDIYFRYIPRDSSGRVLLSRVGEFSLSALINRKFRFYKTEITKFDRRIIELRLLKESMSGNGFWKQVVIYEPVHPSLLDFSAAYSLLELLLAGQYDKFSDNVCALRPRYDTAAHSMVIPFLAGLMRDDVCLLFKVLRPYSVEYVTSFDLLWNTLLEVDITSTAFLHLSPFLPTEWMVRRFSLAELNQPLLRKEETILSRCKMLHLLWDLSYPAHFPETLEVAKLILHVGALQTPLTQSKYGKIRCKDLWCVISSWSERDWQNFLSLCRSIEFERISFKLNISCPIVLTQIYLAVKAKYGDLRNARVVWIQCVLREHSCHLVHILTYLIKYEKLRALQITFLPSPIPDRSIRSPLCNAFCDVLNCDLVAQQQLDVLISRAAYSRSLTSLVLTHYAKSSYFTVSLDDLLSHSDKAWKRLEIKQFSVNWGQHRSNHAPNVKHFCLDRCVGVWNIFQTINIASLMCNRSFFMHDNGLVKRSECTSQLNIVMDKPWVFQKHFLSRAVAMFPNLEFLALTLSSFCYQPSSFLVFDCVVNTITNLNLKGLEICQIERNTQLASQVINGIVHCLKGMPSDIAPFLEQGSQPSSAAVLKIQYLVLHFELNLSFNTSLHMDPEEEYKDVVVLLNLLFRVKQPLLEKTLPRLDILCYDLLPIYLAKYKPGGISSLLEVFPPKEGFTVEHDLWGMRDDDSVNSRNAYDMNYGMNPTVHRFSVSNHGSRVHRMQYLGQIPRIYRWT